jgi:nitrogen regulatory protein PII
MNDKIKVSKITCIVSKLISDTVIESLNKLEIDNVLLRSGRSIVLKENSGILKILNETSFEEDPVDVFEFYTKEEDETLVINTLVKDAQIYLPGRGSIYSQEVELIWEDFKLKDVSPVKQNKENSWLLQENLQGICCIVQRNHSDLLAQQILELAVSVPIITYGEGTGLRDKLNLLRITIPAEKDLMQIVINSDDIENVMPYLIKYGHLNEPGKGFIYSFPIRCGLLNTKFHTGTKKNAASIEQIISVIDSIKGDAEWRKQATAFKKEKDEIKYLQDFAGFTIICNEGFANDIIAEAMRAGAAGATISKCDYKDITNNTKNDSITAARESSTLIIPYNVIEKIYKAIEKAGYITKAQCVFEINPIPKACTYLG